MVEPSPRQKQSIGIQNVQIRNPFRRPAWSSLYRGPGLPNSMTGEVNPTEKVDVDLLFDSIRQIVETRPGERLMLPGFGSRVFELIGEPLSQVFEFKVKQFLTDAVRQWEPRARITGVSFAYDNHTVVVTYSLQMIQSGANAQSTFKVPRA